MTKSLYLEGALVLLAGFLAIGHRFSWVRELCPWQGIGNVFSSFKVFPLFFLFFVSNRSSSSASRADVPAAFRWPLLFFFARKLWQFIGSGILGLLIRSSGGKLLRAPHVPHGCPWPCFLLRCRWFCGNRNEPVRHPSCPPRKME